MQTTTRFLQRIDSQRSLFRLLIALGVLPVSVSLPNGTQGTALYTTTNGGKTWNAPQALASFHLLSNDSIYVANTTHA